MQPITIVVADDDADIRFALAEALEMEGYSVRLAANGLAAIEIIADVGIDRCVVLLDMCMPTMSGEEVLQVLRNEGQLPALPVIVLSATKPAFAAMEGARLCLNKPIALDPLLLVLSRLFDELGELHDVSCSRLRATPSAGMHAAGAQGASADTAPRSARTGPKWK